MTVEQSQLQTKVVDSSSVLLCLLDDLTHLNTSSPILYLDLEGTKLGRDGSISILTLYVVPRKTIYLIDVHGMRDQAFRTLHPSGTSLRSVLESPSIKKVFFDVRNDSDALFAHYGISLDGVQDLQLMELATRKGSKRLVAGLAKCIENDSAISTAKKAEWKQQKERTGRFFKDGRYGIFDERPLTPEIIQYCASDVAFLPGLYDVYDGKLNHSWQVMVQDATKDRIKLSQSANYNGQASDKVLGPWDVVGSNIDDDFYDPFENDFDDPSEDDLYDPFENDFDDWYGDY